MLLTTSISLPSYWIKQHTYTLKLGPQASFPPCLSAKMLRYVGVQQLLPEYSPSIINISSTFASIQSLKGPETLSHMKMLLLPQARTILSANELWPQGNSLTRAGKTPDLEYG